MKVAQKAALLEAMKQGYKLGLADGAAQATNSGSASTLLGSNGAAGPRSTRASSGSLEARIHQEHSVAVGEIIYDFATPVMITRLTPTLLPPTTFERLKAAVEARRRSDAGDPTKSTQGAASWFAFSHCISFHSLRVGTRDVCRSLKAWGVMEKDNFS
jgi:hypothetical protein